MAAMVPPNISAMLAQGGGASPSPTPVSPPPTGAPSPAGAPGGMSIQQMLMFIAGLGFPQLVQNLEKLTKIGKPEQPKSHKAGMAKDAAAAPQMAMNPMIARLIAMKNAGGGQP